ncbi:MAG TPA: DnaJ domain-containing protein [Candidatus Saccharimonadales bacterium]|nr:DnaJ domain-containing protein [Candidatus Saccharimonadales bacterium]
MKDYYKILGVDPNAPLQVIKDSYLNNVRKYHPDTTINEGEKDQMEEKYKLVQEAWEGLGGERHIERWKLDIKSEYDKERRVEIAAGRMTEVQKKKDSTFREKVDIANKKYAEERKAKQDELDRKRRETEERQTKIKTEVTERATRIKTEIGHRLAGPNLGWDDDEPENELRRSPGMLGSDDDPEDFNPSGENKG